MKRRYSDADQYDLLVTTSRSQATINIALTENNRKIISEMRKMTDDHNRKRIGCSRIQMSERL